MPSSNASKIKNSMFYPSKKALCISCHATALFSRRHAMLLCIRLNFQSGKGKVENIGMFNKVRKLICLWKYSWWPLLCSAASHFSHLENFILHLNLAATADELWQACQREKLQAQLEGEERHLLQVRAGVRMVPAKHRLGASRGIGRVDPRVRAVDPLGNM